MTQPATPAPPAETPASGTPAPTDTPNPETSSGDAPLGEAGQRALDRMKAELAAAKAKVKEYEPLAAKAKEAEEAQKSAEVRAREAAAAAEARAAAAESALTRHRIGSELGLPSYLIDRLTGSNEEEIRSDAVALAEKWNGRPKPPPSGAGDAGAKGSAAGATMNDLLRTAVKG